MDIMPSSKEGRSPFDKISNEILYEIFWYLSIKDAMLSTVCRKWRYLVKHLGTINLSFTRLEFLPDNLLDGCFRLRVLDLNLLLAA